MEAHVYEVVIDGVMSPDLIASFPGFEISIDSDGRTVLIGEVLDQSHLLGLLMALNDLHIDLVSLNQKLGRRPDPR